MHRNRSKLCVIFDRADWNQPLLQALEHRNVHLLAQRFDEPLSEDSFRDVGVVFNRVSCGSGPRDPTAHHKLLHDLSSWEKKGLRVINGARAHSIGISKLEQGVLIRGLELHYPCSKRVNGTAVLQDLAQEMQFPLLLKPDAGGSGEGIEFVSEHLQLNRLGSVHQQSVKQFDDYLLQEFHQAVDGCIFRLEYIAGNLVYCLRIVLGDTHNYCPADGCGIREGSVTLIEPDDRVLEEGRRILSAAGVEVGSVEFLHSSRTGQRIYFDLNPYSNFLTGITVKPRLDPLKMLCDYLETTLRQFHTD